MDIIANSIFVENQEEALQFYTNVLGFKKNAMNLSERISLVNTCLSNTSRWYRINSRTKRQSHF